MDLLSMYSNLVPINDLSKIDSNFFYYYGDKHHSNILVRDCIEVDVEKAFPTILTILFGKNHPFIVQMMSIEDKIKRNIFISTTLKEQANIDGKNYLHELNIYAKMLVLSFIYSNWKNITILEFKKDGCLFTGLPNDSNSDVTAELFKSYLETNNVNFHIDEISCYIRYNKTSIYAKNNILEVKGLYKHLPKYIEELFYKLIIENHNIYDRKLEIITKIYTRLFSKILYLSGFKVEFDYYYRFNDKYFTEFNSFSNNPRDLNPELLMKTIIFPVLCLLRSEK